ncbi:Transmembrane protein [Fagus crenata]
MGISASKRVSTTFSNSSEFDSACDSSYSHCLSLTQHAFQGVFPYQLATASDHIHRTLSSLRTHSLILKWVPSPPSQGQVDSAFRAVTRRPNPNSNSSSAQENEPVVIGPTQFKEWAVELYANAVVSNAGKALLCRVPIGIAGIAGIGAVTRCGKDLVGTAIGVYALGVATSVFLSLSG